MARSGSRVSLCALWLLVGCTQSITAEPDAAIVFDPPPPVDAGTDAGPAINSPVGEPCAADSDCGDGVCITEMQGYSMGYCSAICITDEECPTGSVCIMTGGSGSFCFDMCDPAATERECRAYYGCASGLGIPAPICVPGCTDDTDCPTDRTCNPAGGGACYNPAASFADPCVTSSDCNDGMRCFSESRRGFPGGMCLAFGCDVTANTGCPDDGQCIPGGMSGFGRCYDGCTVDEDCRAGYRCTAASTDYPDRLSCTPACADDTVCTEGRTCDTTAGTCG